MNNAILSVIMFFFIFQTVSAEKIPEISLRMSRQDNISRIVIESDDEMIKNANTIVSASTIRIDFPSPFTIKKSESFTYEFTRKDRTINIVPKYAESARTYKLTSPARIVIEIKHKQLDTNAQKNQLQIQQSADRAIQSDQQQKQVQSARPQDKSLMYKTVIIDAGHGGYDNGISANSLKEKDVSISLAKELASTLQKKGLTVLLTRKTDIAVSPIDRISMASGKSADLLLSIHASSSDKFILITASSEDVGGAESPMKKLPLPMPQKKHFEKSRSAVKYLTEALKAEYKTEIISRELPVPILTLADSPAVMIEYPLSGKLTYERKDREKLINTIVKGLSAHE